MNLTLFFFLLTKCQSQNANSTKCSRDIILLCTTRSRDLDYVFIKKKLHLWVSKKIENNKNTHDKNEYIHKTLVSYFFFYKRLDLFDGSWTHFCPFFFC